MLQIIQGLDTDLKIKAKIIYITSFNCYIKVIPRYFRLYKNNLTQHQQN